MTTLLVVYLWVACAGLTTIPLSRHRFGGHLAARYKARHIFAGLLVAWPATLTYMAMDKVRGGL